MIPGFQDIMLPLISVLRDGHVQKIADLVDRIADERKLTESERSEMLPSGKQGRFSNRVHWAATYLVKARVLERPGRGQLRITERGRSILAQDLQRVDLS